MSDLLSRIALYQDTAAFAELFAAFAPRLRDYMRAQGADATTAEELAQETLATVWRKAALYQPDKGAPAAWIFTIARNLRIDRLRKETVWLELTDEMAASLPAADMPQDEAASQSQRQQRVHAVLDDLPADQREVIVLAYIEGLSHGKIAERLALPLGTVKSRMRLAYRKVRAALEDLQ